MVGIGRLQTLAMDSKHFLTPKIHSNFNYSTKITKEFAVPIFPYLSVWEKSNLSRLKLLKIWCNAKSLQGLNMGTFTLLYSLPENTLFEKIADPTCLLLTVYCIPYLQYCIPYFSLSLLQEDSEHGS